MQFRNVLVPFDGSDHALNALEVAKGLIAGTPDAVLHVISVFKSEEKWDYEKEQAEEGVLQSPILIEQEEAYREIVNSKREAAMEKMTRALGHALDNCENKCIVEAVSNMDPAEGIITYAKVRNCDLIVMGRRGTGVVQSLLGSVSSGVLRGCDLPVLTVK